MFAVGARTNPSSNRLLPAPKQIHRSVVGRLDCRWRTVRNAWVPQPGEIRLDHYLLLAAGEMRLEARATCPNMKPGGYQRHSAAP